MLSCSFSQKKPAQRAMGHLLGNAVRFDTARDVMAVGEGIETMLSLRCVMPTMPLSALSAAHVAAILFPPTLLARVTSCRLNAFPLSRMVVGEIGSIVGSPHSRLTPGSYLQNSASRT
jgi:hypothetical protein